MQPPNVSYFSKYPSQFTLFLNKWYSEGIFNEFYTGNDKCNLVPKFQIFQNIHLLN